MPLNPKEITREFLKISLVKNIHLHYLPLELLRELPRMPGVCHVGTFLSVFLSPSHICPRQCSKSSSCSSCSRRSENPFAPRWTRPPRSRGRDGRPAAARPGCRARSWRWPSRRARRSWRPRRRASRPRERPGPAGTPTACPPPWRATARARRCCAVGCRRQRPKDRRRHARRQARQDQIAHRLRRVVHQAGRGRDRGPDDAIAALLERDETHRCLLTVPGIGPKTASELAISINIEDFPGHDRLASYCGLAPRNRQSGTSISSVSASRQGDKRLKNLLVFSCNCLARTNGRWGEYYARCRARGMPHGKALRAVARKRHKVIYAVMRDKVPYVA